MNVLLGRPASWKGSPPWEIRSAGAADRARVGRLVDTARWRHQHLDWSDSLSLLDRAPFLLACERGHPVACLALPPDRPDLTWLRLFALAGGRDLNEAWSSLWTEGAAAVERLGIVQVWALATYAWLPRLLEGSGFRPAGGVVFLEAEASPSKGARPASGRIRAMTTEDWEGVLALDQRAFEPAWALSSESLQAAASQASVATVIEAEGRLLGYQISSSSAYGLHLARLAVEPEVQARGLGGALVGDVLAQAERMGVPRVSVNTQTDNAVSRHLYTRMGFRETGQEFPVFRLDLKGTGRREGMHRG